MSYRTTILAAVASLGLAATTAPRLSDAQTVQTIQGRETAPLTVPMNRSLLVQSDEPFTELSIANPGIAEILSLSDRSISLLGKEPGRTTLTILGADGRLIRNVAVQVAPDLSQFRARLDRALPNERIDVRTANHGIVLSGNVSSAEALGVALELAESYTPDRVSNLMSVGSARPMALTVRVVEMQRVLRRSLASSIAAQNIDVFGVSDVERAPGPHAASGVVATTADGMVLFGFDKDALATDVLLDTLERRGVVRTLAQPTLSLPRGDRPMVLPSGASPVPVSHANGEGSVDLRFLGLDLSFTPRAIDHTTISLDLSTAIAPDAASIASRDETAASDHRRALRATTIVQIDHGKSFAIAGLLPDAPFDPDGSSGATSASVLAGLQRSPDFRRGETELVLIVTPYLITPSWEERRVPAIETVGPTAGDDRFLFGGTVTRIDPFATGIAAPAPQAFPASYGYLVN